MRILSRRQFLKLSAASVTGATLIALDGCATSSGSSASQSSEASTSTSPQSSPAAQASDSNRLVSTFFVVSDTHIAGDLERSIDHFRGMLADIKTFERQPSTIVIVGDVTNGGNRDEYDLARELCAESGFNFDDDFIKTMGNHDQYNPNYPEEGGREEEYHNDEHLLFMDEIGRDSVYYDTRVDGLHFIILGPDALSSDWMHFNFTPEQMAWLDNLLAIDAANGETSFVFCHEPLHNTVRGTAEGGWGYRWSLYDDNELSSIMQRYKNAIYFSGHTHAYPDIQRPNPEGALYVNDGAVATGQRSPNAQYSTQGFGGSFGVQVQVYERRIDFKVRDFLEKTWVSDVSHRMLLA